MNQKGCEQFSSGDKPHIVTCSVRLSNADNEIRVAKNTWVVRNACVKAAAAWRRTLRSAGIYRKKQLNTYARYPRFAYDENHSKVWLETDSSNALGVDIIPVGADTSYDTGVFTADGDEIKVIAANSSPDSTTPWSAQFVRSLTQTTFAVPQSGSTDVLDKKANLLGDASATYSNIVAEYIDSRINDAEIEDTDLDESPSNDNDFVMMLAPGEEVADDVLDNVDDEGKWRPYALSTAKSDAIALEATANVAGQATTIHAPLGMMKWTPSATTDRLIVDVVAISEM